MKFFIVCDYCQSSYTAEEIKGCPKCGGTIDVANVDQLDKKERRYEGIPSTYKGVPVSTNSAWGYSTDAVYSTGHRGQDA